MPRTPASPAPGLPAVDSASIHLRRMPSPIGRIEVVSDGSAVISLAIERDGRLPLDALPEHGDEVLELAIAQLEQYFAGDRHDFDLPVELPGTVFQRAVWQHLAEVGWGEVVTYGELGLATGRATAGRAVGGAIGANPIPIIVPCHRVMGSTGRITGYSAGEGIPTKSWLLAHEGIPHTVPSGAAPRRDAVDEAVDAAGDERASAPTLAGTAA